MESNNLSWLRPKKNSIYHQGYVDPRSCKKLINTSRSVIYRSGWEKKFVRWMELSPQVIKWDSEPFPIPYRLPDGSMHNYYPDYYLELNDGKHIMIEIKPKSQTTPPKINESDKRYQRAWKTWIKNNCKWGAAKKFCLEHGLNFYILTENTINYI